MVDIIWQGPRVQTPIGLTPYHTWSLPGGNLWTEFYRTNKGYLLRFPGLADYEISSELSTAACYPSPGTSAATAEHLYLNQVLPLVLGKRGKLVFHGSAVEIEDGAVVFIAESGRGKSTLAASFSTNGYRFLTDDGVILEPLLEGYMVQPSHPSIRLWDDSRDALIPRDATAAPAIDYTPKARFYADEAVSFCDQPKVLRRVYFLGAGDSDTIRVEPVSASEALLEWVKHTFLLDIEERSRLASHFNQVADLANLPVHFRLDYPRDYSKLAEVRSAIVHHVKEALV